MLINSPISPSIQYWLVVTGCHFWMGRMPKRMGIMPYWLVVTGCHQFYFPRNIGLLSSSQLTKSIIFQRGGSGPPTRIVLEISCLFLLRLHLFKHEIPKNRTGHELRTYPMFEKYPVDGGGSIDGGTPKWLVEFISENPTKLDHVWGYHHLWKPPYPNPRAGFFSRFPSQDREPEVSYEGTYLGTMKRLGSDFDHRKK